MPWFKIDDASHSHPKFMAAGNAALGLWLRCGAYSAQHLTEGIVPGAIATLYGTEPQARKLVKVGLWHPAGHDCPRCPQPNPGDFVVHDFFEGGRNVTRTQHEANKKGAAERAAKSRASRKGSRSADESSSNRERFGDENYPNRPRKDPLFSDGIAGQEGLSHRTPAEGAAPAHATSMPYQVLPTEVPPPPPPSETSSTTTVEVSGRGEVQPLIEAMEARGMRVAWSFSAAEWLELRDAVRRAGAPALVDHAARAWQAAKSQPYSAKYFLRGWTGVQAPTTFTGPRPVAPPSAASNYVAQMAAIAEELREGETA